MQAAVQFSAARFDAQEITQGSGLFPAPVDAFFLFAETQGDFKAGARGENLLDVDCVLFAFDFAALDRDRRKPGGADGADAFFRFRDLHPVAR
jgi:hypothetical protein